MKKLTSIILAAGLIVAACQSDKNNDSKAAGDDVASKDAPVVLTDVDLTGNPVTVAGITFRPPANWTDLGPSGMRHASYYLQAVDGETDSATVTVFYFGPESGGSVEANIDRWIGQMATSESDNSSERATRETMEANGLPVHYVAVDGAYSGTMGGPMSGGPAVTIKENYRMVAAVVEAPEGNVFFKLTGPQKTAAAMSGGFMAMVMNVQKAS